MNKMIACCGINCETCEARIATIKNDDKMRVEVAKPSASTSQEKMPIRLTGRNGKAMKWKRN